jgi:hypothetical protein
MIGVFWKEGVKTYLIAPMSPPTSPIFFSVYTCIVYGIHVNNHRANTLFSRISAEYRCHGSWEDAGVRFVIVSPLHAEDTFYCVASQLLATPTATWPPIASASSDYSSSRLDELDPTLYGARGASYHQHPSHGPILVSYFRTSCSPAAVLTSSPSVLASTRRGQALGSSSFQFDRGGGVYLVDDLVSFNISLTGKCSPLFVVYTAIVNDTYIQL